MSRFFPALLIILSFASHSSATPPGQYRLVLKPEMITSSSSVTDFSGLVDEQFDLGDPPSGEPATPWISGWVKADAFPISATFDLGQKLPLATLWLYDTNGKGDIKLDAGEPDNWQTVAEYDCGAYKRWQDFPLNLEARYLRLTVIGGVTGFNEIALDVHSKKGYQALVAKQAEQRRLEEERQAALTRAREEALKRPLVEMEPYGTLSLVDEIDCATDTTHLFQQSPADASRVETILGKPTRELPPTADEAAYFSYRIGKMKLLRPGGVYVLAVEYPEDAPRSMVVINTGNETSRGFHTGTTMGDAMHAKYVNSLCESLDVPLSGKWETWSLLFRLHDNFPERGLVRGPKPRPLSPEDGFDVTIAQFSAKNTPMSKGAAVSRIRLFEVVDADELSQPLKLPPEDLPHRRLFWREEMADGVLDQKADPVGIVNPIDWYRYKAELMRFLGMNTYSKDLLEFGACQHWDSTPLGGNDWVFHDSKTKHLWAEIVAMMGDYGFDVLPYYEYSGSKGYKGLGNQRRARPLTRDDAYTHISWIESANADITDPDTYEDFQKMLDLTVVRLRNQASFAGIWVRPRSQMPVSFSDKALARFAKEADNGQAVTRDLLKKDSDLYAKYLAWWHIKRREFLTAMRDYLRNNGVSDAAVLYTGCPGEPGVTFNSWDPRIVTDRPDLWKPILDRPEHQTANHGAIQPITIEEVVNQNLYLDALLAPGLNWGDWEIHHSRPADDPENYRDTDGVLLTHAFNRNYTVASPETFETFRGPSGLAMIRHYSLNENMMFDKNDQDILGYFVADIERAGPYCMMGEALAIANGDPTMIGYLAGCNFGRGFPKYVRNFNANFLALPALPSQLVRDVCDEPSIVVRKIETPNHGTWYALVNTAMTSTEQVSVRLPAQKPVVDAVSDQALSADGVVKTSFYPFQLKAWRVK